MNPLGRTQLGSTFRQHLETKAQAGGAFTAETPLSTAVFGAPLRVFCPLRLPRETRDPFPACKRFGTGIAKKN